MITKPYRVDARELRLGLLVEGEVWVHPYSESRRFPLVIALYVPLRLRDEVLRCFPPPGDGVVAGGRVFKRRLELVE